MRKYKLWNASPEAKIFDQKFNRRFRNNESRYRTQLRTLKQALHANKENMRHATTPAEKNKYLRLNQQLIAKMRKIDAAYARRAQFLMAEWKRQEQVLILELP